MDSTHLGLVIVTWFILFIFYLINFLKIFACPNSLEYPSLDIIDISKLTLYFYDLVNDVKIHLLYTYIKDQYLS